MSSRCVIKGETIEQKEPCPGVDRVDVPELLAAAAVALQPPAAPGRGAGHAPGELREGRGPLRVFPGGESRRRAAGGDPPPDREVPPGSGAAGARGPCI